MSLIVFATFEEAAGAQAEGETVCGTRLPDGTPQYFLMPVDSSEPDVQAAAFEAREGRAMNEFERLAASIGHRRKIAAGT